LHKAESNASLSFAPWVPFLPPCRLGLGITVLFRDVLLLAGDVLRGRELAQHLQGLGFNPQHLKNKQKEKKKALNLRCSVAENV
jgi:hypothetical protein